MKNTGIKMDCLACGKPISITAKFCGKCGAPFKRDEPPIAAEPAIPTVEATQTSAQESALNESEVVSEIKASNAVDELVFTIELPKPSAEHNTILNIDLNLPPQQLPVSDKRIDQLVTPVIKTEDSQSTSQHDATTKWVAQWEADQDTIKSLLEKHSHLLDFISLSAQQQAYLQSQPNPVEPLLKEVIEQQSKIDSKLDLLNQHAKEPAAHVEVKMPEEFKLLLEKQKIELQKFFSQNIAQNSSNIEAVTIQTISKIESMLASNATVTENLEKSLAPMAQMVNDLKTRLQAISKKIDESAAQTKKSASSNAGDSTEGSGGFIIFIIGLMCGLTVVLSSLAIYNFLSHESASPSKTAQEQSDTEHDKTPAKEGHDSADSNHPAAAHESPAAGSQAKEKTH